MCLPRASAIASVTARASLILRKRSPRASRKDIRRSCSPASRSWRERSRGACEGLSVIMTRRLGIARHSAPLDGFGKPVEHRDGGRPVDAGIGDALPVAQGLAGDLILPPRDEMTLDHDAADAPIPGFELAGDGVDH